MERLINPGWPIGLCVAIGSQWETKQPPLLRGALIAADLSENSVILQLEETEDFKAELATKLIWQSTAQELCEKWSIMSN